jgi:sigma-E factor negative regulatory protein RseC
MIETKVKVVASCNGELLVESTERSGCGGCGSRSVCGVSGLAKYFSGGRKPVVLSCAAAVQPGAELQLQMSEGDLLKSGLLAYLVPSVFAIAGAAVATLAGYGDVFAVLGAAAGVGAGLLLVRLSSWSPQIIAKSEKQFAAEDTERQ